MTNYVTLLQLDVLSCDTLRQWNHVVLEGVSGWEMRAIERVATCYRDSVRELLTAVRVSMLDGVCVHTHTPNMFEWVGV